MIRILHLRDGTLQIAGNAEGLKALAKGLEMAVQSPGSVFEAQVLSPDGVTPIRIACDEMRMV